MTREAMTRDPIAPDPMTADALALVLAAGKGTRMRSALPKVLVPLAGEPIVSRLLSTLESAGISRFVVVVGHQAEEVTKALGARALYALQAEQRGMAHAVAAARPVVDRLVPRPRHVLVTVGDSPLLRRETVERLLARHGDTGAHCTFLTAEFGDPPPYARVVRDAAGRVVRCVEEHSATPEERGIRELLTSHFVFEATTLFENVGAVRPSPVTGELYLTDMVAILLARGLRVEAVRCEDYRELVGLNTPEEVAWAEEILRERHD